MIRMLSSPKGFTLVELILVIIVAGIFGAILVNFFGPLTRIADPLQSTDNLMEVNTVMARIVADYEEKKSTGQISTVSDFNAFMGLIGASGQTLTNAYGTYTVIENNTIVDNMVDPRRLTISVNQRRLTYLFVAGR